MKQISHRNFQDVQVLLNFEGTKKEFVEHPSSKIYKYMLHKSLERDLVWPWDRLMDKKNSFRFSVSDFMTCDRRP